MVLDYIFENLYVERYTYVYHYQSLDGEVVFRYDNTNHYPVLENAPHHKHVGENTVTPSQAPELKDILREVGDNFVSSNKPSGSS